LYVCLYGHTIFSLCSAIGCTCLQRISLCGNNWLSCTGPTSVPSSASETESSGSGCHASGRAGGLLWSSSSPGRSSAGITRASSSTGDGHRILFALAIPVRRTTDRFDSPGMPGPCDRTRRGPSAPRSVGVLPLLSRSPIAPVAGPQLADSSARLPAGAGQGRRQRLFRWSAPLLHASRLTMNASTSCRPDVEPLCARTQSCPLPALPGAAG